MKKARLTFGIAAAFLFVALAAVTLFPADASAAPLHAALTASVHYAWAVPLLGARPADIKAMRAAVAGAKTKARVKNDRYNTLAAKEGRSADEESEMSTLAAELDQYEAAIGEANDAIAAEERQVRRGSLFAPAPPAVTEAVTPAARRSVAALEMVSNEPDPARTGGFRSIAEFANAVRAAVGPGGVVDERLAAPANVHQNAGTAGEGFLVPAEYRQEIWQLVFAEDDLLTRIDLEPTVSNSVMMPKDETTPWGASGVQARWRGEEGTQMSASKLGVKGEQVTLDQLYAFVNATDELLADAPRLRNHLTQKAASAIRWKASDAIMWGDGVAKPLGFMNAGALVTVAKEAGQTAATINVANVSNMFSRVLPGGIGSAFWMANQDTLPQIMQLQIGNQPIWTPPNAGFANAPGGFLLGRPLLLSEHPQTLGTVGDLALVNPMGYFGLQKAGGGIDFASSIHLYFDYAVEAFRWTFRMGGRPYLSAPIAAARGSASKSHFVALATRA